MKIALELMDAYIEIAPQILKLLIAPWTFGVIFALFNRLTRGRKI